MINLFMIEFDSLFKFIVGLCSVIFVFKFFTLKYFRQIRKVKRIKNNGTIVYGQIVDIKEAEDFDTAKVYFPIIEYLTNSGIKKRFLSETHYIEKPVVGESIELIVNETNGEIIDNIDTKLGIDIFWLVISVVFILVLILVLVNVVKVSS